jgi:alanine racemase
VPSAEAFEFVRHVAKLPGLRIEGLWTHLAVADDPERDATTNAQLDRFDALLRDVAADGLRIPVVHAANSAGTIAHPRARYGMVRTGVAVYGLPPSGALAPVVRLRPAMRLVSSVASVRRVRAGDSVSYGHTWTADRDSWIATVPAGYADGVRRLLSNVGEVLLRGARRPVAGIVTMDGFMVDCGDDEVVPGDEVVILGDGITADEIAARIGTINYEVVTLVGPRVPRVYVG